jgi:hypothetical protein
MLLTQNIGTALVINLISGVMVSVLASSAIDHGSDQVKPKTIKLVFVASPLCTHH